MIGHGRFGAALMTLLAAHGHRCLAWDSASAVPEAQGVADLDGLLARSDLIVIAVPVAVFETVLEELRPRLGPQHLVMDVCSVKQGPCALMDKLLGDAVPHIGCHPLFGPLSIARAEALRTVLSPSPQHSASVQARRFG
ncbi:MAG: prephenate dehydrogenase/arogenate dehydrogenase family protein [Rudaea sp.]